MTHVLSRTLNTCVPPGRILRRHSHYLAPNLSEHAGASSAAPGVGPLPRDQFAMPSENCVGRDERRNVSQHGASEPVPQHCESATLRIGQS